MARPLRLEFPGAVYHLTARGNARQDIYLDDSDRQRFLGLLGREVQQQVWKCYAYCLMNNHYHLLIETPEANLVQGMRRLNGVYTQAFNHRHHRVGHLFQGRYKSIVVDKDNYLLELCRYIVLNPVRAGLAIQPEDWTWSSYYPTAYKTTTYSWLDAPSVLELFGDNEREARHAYRRFVAQGVGMISPWENLRGQMWLGGDDFLKRMQGKLKAELSQEVPFNQTQPARPTKEEIIQAVSEGYRIPLGSVLERSNPLPFQAAVYLLRRVTNLNLKEVSKLAQISLPRISQIQRKIEDGIGDDVLKKLMRIYKVKT